ncbi:magnesium transporter CorA family protein [Deinococcus sonorensis]|uniref:Magnesium transporter CorA family protein n=2 Tax=Deinococcus sonorensis TaxID=309891 RepID=A0AAU7U4M0_9DEIO
MPDPLPAPTPIPAPVTPAPPVNSAVHTYMFDQDGASAVLWQAGMTTPAPGHGFVWFDVTDPAPADLEALQTQFRLHPLAVEDALHAHQRAKVESYPNFEFVVAHGVSRDPHGQLRVHEFNLFIGEHFLISVRHGSGLGLQEILTRWERVPEHWRQDSSSLLYVLLDALVDEYAPFAEQLEGELTELRQQIMTVQADDDRQLHRIFELSELAHLAHAVVFPLKDVLSTLVRAGPPVVSPQEVPYFRDIRDHAVHTLERLDLARSMADRAFDIYYAMENRRQGASSRQLTMVATIFLPLTLVTGFFGQNFGYLIDHVINTPRAFWVLGVGLEVLVAVVTVLLVQRVGQRPAPPSGRRRALGDPPGTRPERRPARTVEH